MKRKLLLALSCCLFIVKADATTWTIQTGEGGTMTFSPSSLSVTLGDTITWVWETGSHTTTSTTLPGGAASWDHPLSSGSTSYTYVPTVTGNYSYKCTPHESMGMTGSFTVTACTPPVSTTIFGASSVCAGNLDTLVVPAGPGYVFAWYRDGVAVPGATSNTYVAADTEGVFNYNVVVSNSCGADTTDSFTLVVNPVPLATISDSMIGSSVTFSTPELFGATYLWNLGDGTTSSDFSFSHSFSMGGVTDTVTLTVTSFDGCVGTNEIVIVTPPTTSVTHLNAGNSSITVFPNPAKDEITLSGVQQGGTFRLCNAVGACVLHGAFNKGTNCLRLNNLQPGMYLLELNMTDGTRDMIKVMKE